MSKREPARVEQFDAILALEHDMRLVNAAYTFTPSGASDRELAARKANRDAARDRLYAVVNALSDEELTAYGAYRKSAWGTF